MWKYRCKMQLIALGLSFVAGMILMATALYSGTDAVAYQVVPAEMIDIIEQNKALVIGMGGLVIAGICNIILISQLLFTQYNLNPLVIYALMFFVPNYMIMAGTLLVIPMVILSLYGVWSLRSIRTKEFKAAKISGDQELIRIYELHHKLDPSVKKLAEDCRKNVDRAGAIYLLGIAAVLCVIFLISNIWITLLVLLFYMMALNMVARYRATCLIPINKLLYEDCNPEACISAIIYYSTKRGKVKLTNQALMAQCLIYMNDPDMAQDVLITYPKRDAASTLTYWSLMAYIYYLQKDEAGLHRCLEEAGRVRLNFGPTGVMIRSEELASIQNKIDLMDGDFNTCKKYYLDSLKKARFNFQKADADYYIGLISFVQKDYDLARLYFENTVSIGNKLYFVENAKNYLAKLDTLVPDTSE